MNQENKQISDEKELQNTSGGSKVDWDNVRCPKCGSPNYDVRSSGMITICVCRRCGEEFS